MDNIYEKLGVKRLINAAGTYTMVGGSRMSERTLEAMRSAAGSFVDIRELQRAVHKRLAELTKNEAACVTTGAAAGIYVTIASCVAEKLDKPFAHLSKDEVEKCEVIIYRAHRNPYDWAVRQLGVKLVEVGYPNEIQPAAAKDLEHAIGEHSAAIFYVAQNRGGWTAPGALDLESVISVAKGANLPVIVDAAAQLPPVENLWNFTDMGAAAAIFSGGKDLRGPQASGLVVGKRFLIERIVETNFPNYGIGRMLKIGREELVGLLVAVEEYVSMGNSRKREWCEGQVKRISDVLAGFCGISVERSFPNEAGQPIPRALVRFSSTIDEPAKRVLEELMRGDPGIFVMAASDDAIFINPMTLEEGEVEVVIKRLKDIALQLNNFKR
ncbi:hypothetical protein [Acetomicrobium sp. S15 = DSM 107314]|uniref:hypothetical protein n=1 Tax=Acetomicrobium sp. S15 = DSM 107314 TaxID=2529858 RepID=UPI0018E18E19